MDSFAQQASDEIKEQVCGGTRLLEGSRRLGSWSSETRAESFKEGTTSGSRSPCSLIKHGLFLSLPGIPTAPLK